MKYAILGTMTDLEISVETLDSLTRIFKIEDKDLEIDLLFLNDNSNIDTIDLPINVTIKVYTKITGTSIRNRYVELVDHYNKRNEFSHFVIALDTLNDDLVPLLGERLSIISFLDCIGLEINSNSELILLKPEYSGNVTSHYALKQPAIFSFRHQNTEIPTWIGSKVSKVQYISYEYNTDDMAIKREVISSDSTNIEDEKFVIVCGFGVGNKENVQEIIKYGKKIGAIVCGTKKIIDSGWLPMNLLIGQTGHIISPNLCITIGVSGAAPLLNGIISSKKIIAINNDKDARIFSYADYGIIGDYKQVLFKGLVNYENN